MHPELRRFSQLVDLHLMGPHESTEVGSLNEGSGTLVLEQKRQPYMQNNTETFQLKDRHFMKDSISYLKSPAQIIFNKSEVRNAWLP